MILMLYSVCYIPRKLQAAIPEHIDFMKTCLPPQTLTISVFSFFILQTKFLLQRVRLAYTKQ